MYHPEPRHRSGDAVFGGSQSPAARFGGVGRDSIALKQQEAQHVLRRAVALFGRLAVKSRRAR
jgi:hypothetical protein